MARLKIVTTQPVSTAERLERLARRPLQPRRDWLLWLAAKHRELDALEPEREAAASPIQLEFEERAA